MDFEPLCQVQQADFEIYDDWFVHMNDHEECRLWLSGFLKSPWATFKYALYIIWLYIVLHNTSKKR